MTIGKKELELLKEWVKKNRTEREMLYKQGKKNIVPLDVWLSRIFPQDVATKKKSGVKKGDEKNVK